MQFATPRPRTPITGTPHGASPAAPRGGRSSSSSPQHDRRQGARSHASEDLRGVARVIGIPRAAPHRQTAGNQRADVDARVRRDHKYASPIDRDFAPRTASSISLSRGAAASPRSPRPSAPRPPPRARRPSPGAPRHPVSSSCATTWPATPNASTMIFHGSRSFASRTIRRKNGVMSVTNGSDHS